VVSPRDHKNSNVKVEKLHLVDVAEEKSDNEDVHTGRIVNEEKSIETVILNDSKLTKKDSINILAELSVENRFDKKNT